MNFRAVGKRCAVVMEELDLGISDSQALGLLQRAGFEVQRVDMCALARRSVGRASYRRGAYSYEAPSVFDCSSFTQWLYAQKGIQIPRRSIQQRDDEDARGVLYSELRPGDLVFTEGRRPYYRTDPADGVGHVGFFCGDGMVIHASSPSVGVVETPLSHFVQEGEFRGAKRYLPTGKEVLTLLVPEDREVWTSDDICWIIRSLMPREN